MWVNEWGENFHRSQLKLVRMKSKVTVFKASTVDDDNWERFFETVFPARLKALSLEALEAGMLKIPITSLLRAGN